MAFFNRSVALLLLFGGLLLLLLQHQVAFGFVVVSPTPATKKKASSVVGGLLAAAAAANNEKNPTSRRTTQVIPELDPTDPQYQVSKEYPPNKESSWSFPIHQDGWILAHDTLRFEMSNIRDALEVVLDREQQRERDDEKKNNKLEDWIIQYLQDVWKVHRELVHVHHTDEDKIMVPVLRKRFVWPERLEAAHVEIEQALHQLDDIVQYRARRAGSVRFYHELF